MHQKSSRSKKNYFFFFRLKKLSAIGLVLLTHSSFAQSYIDLLNVNYKVSPSNKYDANSSLYDEVDVENVTASLRLPFKRKNGDVILGGVAWDQLSFRAEGAAIATGRFYTAGLQLGYQKKFGDSANVLFMLLPKIASDLEEPDNQHFQYGGLLLFNRVKNENFEWKYGLYVNTEYFGFFMVPLIGFDWKVTERLRLFGTLPAAMTGEYYFGSHYRSGLKFVAPTVSYRFSTEADAPYLHQYTNQLSWYHDVYLTKSIVLQLQAGFTAFRYYRAYEEDERFDVSISGVGIGGPREYINEGLYADFSDGFVFQAGLIYRYELEKRD